MMLLRIIEPGLSPELAGDLDGVDAGRLPPRPLVAGAMDGAVMRAQSERRIRRPALPQVLSVAIAARCGNREDALINCISQNLI